MPASVHIVDSGQGNISSVKNALERLGATVIKATRPSELEFAERLILPGVGSFDTAMRNLSESGLDAAIVDFARSGRPVLGICLGMQLLAESSEEGAVNGLALLRGTVIKMLVNDPFRYKIPHNGWNTLSRIGDSTLLNGISGRDRFFFLHGYRWQTGENPEVLALSDYETSFPAVVGAGNVFGVQFHPEKSHATGRKLLENFLKL